MSKVTYVDLDALVPDTLVLKFKGVEYALAPVTLADFLKNLSVMQTAGKTDDPKKAISLMRDILERAFPTAPKAMFEDMTLAQLNHLVQKVREFNGEARVEGEMEQAATGNPPTAG